MNDSVSTKNKADLPVLETTEMRVDAQGKDNGYDSMNLVVENLDLYYVNMRDENELHRKDLGTEKQVFTDVRRKGLDNSTVSNIVAANGDGLQ